MKAFSKLIMVAVIAVAAAASGCKSDHTSSNPAYDQNDVTDTADKANAPTHNGPVADPAIGNDDKQQ